VGLRAPPFPQEEPLSRESGSVISAVSGDSVEIDQSAVRSVDAERVELRQAAAQNIRGDSLDAADSALLTVRATDVRMDDCASLAVIGEHVTMKECATVFLFAVYDAASETVHVQTPAYFGLDFFVLNLLFTGFLFIPLERMAPHIPEQTVFRAEWREDLFYYLVSSLFVQVLAFLTLAPAKIVVAVTKVEFFRQWVGSQNVVLQVAEIMFLTDLVQYWVHRLFHKIPFLWGFHAVHHSAKSMDWLAGSRQHILELLITRTLVLAPIYVLGFSKEVIDAYIVIVGFQAVFNHANVSVRLGPLRYIIVTPNFHHWHHSQDQAALDRNYAAHYAFLDYIFGTAVKSDQLWPEKYGVLGDYVPNGFVKQFKFPFTWKG